MKKALLLLFSCLIVFSFSTMAYSNESKDRGYLSINTGIGILTDSDWTDSTGSTINVEFGDSMVVGVALGYHFGNNRAEGEFSYRKNNFDKIHFDDVSFAISGDIVSSTILLNYYYDFVTNSDLTPFVSIGMGFSKVDVKNFVASGVGGDDTVFAAQVSAGISYAINDNVAAELKYRFFKTEDPEIENTDMDYNSHNILFGLKFYF